MKVRAHVIFTGKVQGVWFRANTQQKAAEIGVTGWVRNLPDGNVEALFEGEKAKVEAVIEWCAHNQPYARVNKADTKWEKYTGEFSRFEVRR